MMDDPNKQCDEESQKFCKFLRMFPSQLSDKPTSTTRRPFKRNKMQEAMYFDLLCAVVMAYLFQYSCSWDGE